MADLLLVLVTVSR